MSQNQETQSAPITATVTPIRRQKAAPVAMPVLPPDIADLMRLDIKQVAALVGRSQTSLREMIRDAKFPQADYRAGERCVRWSTGLVRRWLEATTQKN